MLDEQEGYSISVAGIDRVENYLGVEDKKTFYQEMVQDYPEVAEKLGYWFDYINGAQKKMGKERKGIREVTYGLLKHTLDKFVVAEEDE